MNFGEAVDDIVSIVKRPDKVVDIRAAINRAIGLFATSTWAADLVELTHTLASPNSYIHQIAINTTPFERFRKIKYIRPSNYQKYLTFRDPSRVFSNGCEALDVWYRSGVYIYVKLYRLNSTLEMGYYQYHSVLLDDDDEDWMITEMWPAVQAYVLAEINDEIGNVEAAGRNARKWPVLLQAYKNDLGDGISNA